MVFISNNLYILAAVSQFTRSDSHCTIPLPDKNTDAGRVCKTLDYIQLLDFFNSHFFTISMHGDMVRVRELIL